MALKYVDELVRPAIIDTVILAKCKQGNVTIDNLEREVKNIGIPLDGLTVRERVEELQESGHCELEGNNVTLTDDGKEDINKVLPWFQKVSQILTPTTATGGMRR